MALAMPTTCFPFLSKKILLLFIVDACTFGSPLVWHMLQPTSVLSRYLPISSFSVEKVMLPLLLIIRDILDPLQRAHLLDHFIGPLPVVLQHFIVS